MHDSRIRPVSLRVFLAAAFTALLSLSVVPNSSDADDKEPLAAGNHAEAVTWLNRKLSSVAASGPLRLVWLLDESRNMPDDRRALLESLHTLYSELDDDTDTVVISFGANARIMTKAPLVNTIPGFAQLRRAFDRTPFDESGQENMCLGISFAVNELSRQADIDGRQLAIVALTDESPFESGDTTSAGDELEQTIQLCRKEKVPVYVIGREAIFGKPTARIIWKDPVYQLSHWVQINRGPETAYPYRLQWNGLNEIKDSWPSAFGPYSHERLCLETTGGFFILQPTSNIDDFKHRRAAMVGYEPSLATRREAALAISRSPLRSECRSVIEILNPQIDKKLNLSDIDYSTNKEEFLSHASKDFKNGGYALALLDEAIKRLEKVRPAREQEPSKRWMANYDLLLAQCQTYRFRLIQYLLVLDRHAATSPEPSNNKHNRWTMQSIHATTQPTPDEHARLKKLLGINTPLEDFIKLQETRQTVANTALKQVIASHPGTPWSSAAQSELGRGFGLSLKSTFRSPRYQEVGKRIKIPAF